MNKRKWKGFKSCLEMFIENHKSEVFVNSEGCGVWEGIKEKNNTYVFSTKNPLDLDRLERISKLFKQDAIALIAGCNTQFIG